MMPHRSRAGLRDGRSRFAEGATKALLARAQLAGGERNEFSGMSLVELARAALAAAGQAGGDLPRSALLRAAMSGAGGHATSDFPALLANVARKALLKGFAEAPETYPLWTSPGTLDDFHPASRVASGLFPPLARVEEGTEYSSARLDDRGVTIALAKFGKLFTISWEALVNDDLGALTRVPLKMGQAARRTTGDLVCAVLTGGPTMSDGAPLFHADHGNLATGPESALSATSLSAARLSMRMQPDPLNLGAVLNIRPAFLIVPGALEDRAAELLTAAAKPDQPNPEIRNPLAGMAQIIVEPRLDDVSATAWYLAADPRVADTIEVSTLDGHDEPELSQAPGFTVDGVKHKVRHVVGAAALDWRGLFKSTGA